MREATPLIKTLAAWVAVLVVLAGCAQGGGGDSVELVALLDGVDIATTDASSPIRLDDREPSTLALALTNVTAEPIVVRYVRFEGEVLDTIFLTYDTAVSVALEPGETRRVPPLILDFYDLGGQASGYLRGTLQLYDGDREPLGSAPLFLDARGDRLSTLGQFNLLLLAATVLGAAWNLFRLSQRRLPGNRLVRATRFLAIGVGAALTLAVAFSTLRIWPLPTVTWVLFVAVGAVAGYLVGFVLPGADDDLVDLLDEQELVDAVAADQKAAGGAAPMTGSGARATIVSDDR